MQITITEIRYGINAGSLILYIQRNCSAHPTIYNVHTIIYNPTLSSIVITQITKPLNPSYAVKYGAKNSLFAPFTISHPSETGVYYIDIHKTPSLFLNSLNSNSSFFLNFVNLHLVTPVSIASRLQLRQQLALQIVIIKVLALVLSDDPCSVVTFRAFISSWARRREAGTFLVGVLAIWRPY